MRRTLALLPLSVAGLALAIGARAESPSSAAPTWKSAALTTAKKKTHLGGKHTRTDDVANAHAPPARRADYDVVEGSLGPPIPGATCPREMADIDDRFCIDRWEGALVETTPEGADVPWPAFERVDEGRRLRAVSMPDVYPQAYISGKEAAQACAASGKRLCAPVEWRQACRGPSPKTFGYGNQRLSGRCNDSGQSPMLRYYPQVNVSWSLVGMTEMNDPRLNQLPGTLAPTGAFDGCTNDYGVYDMVGNLHEWTDDPNGTFQGGYYLDTHKNGDGCSYRTVAHEFTYHDYSTGFRCCASPAAP